MTRPRKATVDYFPHDCVHGKTMFILEQRYGNDGYAFWFKVLELLGSSDNHFIDCRNPATWEFLQAKTRLPADICEEILNLLSTLEAIDPKYWSKKIIWSKKFLANIADVYKNRRVDIPLEPDNYEQKPTSDGITTRRNPQTKLNEIKLNNNIRGNEFHENVLPKKKRLKKPENGYSAEFETFWKEIVHRPDDRKADAYRHWKQKTNIPPIQELLGIVRRYNDSKNSTEPEHILATYNWIKNELYLTQNKPKEDSIQRWLSTRSQNL